jgi:hypothetical protein
VPPAVKLAAAICARPALDPDIIAAEIVEVAILKKTSKDTALYC